MQDKENHYENLPRLTTCSSTCKYSNINEVHEKNRDNENPSIPYAYFKSWYSDIIHLQCEFILIIPFASSVKFEDSLKLHHGEWL